MPLPFIHLLSKNDLIQIKWHVLFKSLLPPAFAAVIECSWNHFFSKFIQITENCGLVLPFASGIFKYWPALIFVDQADTRMLCKSTRKEIYRANFERARDSWTLEKIKTQEEN